MREHILTIIDTRGDIRELNLEQFSKICSASWKGSGAV